MSQGMYWLRAELATAKSAGTTRYASFRSLHSDGHHFSLTTAVDVPRHAGPANIGGESGRMKMSERKDSTKTSSAFRLFGAPFRSSKTFSLRSQRRFQKC